VGKLPAFLLLIRVCHTVCIGCGVAVVWRQSEADLLDILSNGNTPTRIVHHINKVLLATATLDLDESKGGRPFARKFISSVGVEEVELSPPVHLDGKVEIYLQVRTPRTPAVRVRLRATFALLLMWSSHHLSPPFVPCCAVCVVCAQWVLDGQRDALKEAVKASMVRFPTQDRIVWLMDKNEKGKPTDPAQVMLVVAGTAYVKDVEGAFDSIEVGDADGMKKVYEGILEQLKDLVKQTHKNLDRGTRQRCVRRRVPTVVHTCFCVCCACGVWQESVTTRCLIVFVCLFAWALCVTES
jgi:dynein heavy chain